MKTKPNPVWEAECRNWEEVGTANKLVSSTMSHCK